VARVTSYQVGLKGAVIERFAPGCSGEL